MQTIDVIIPTYHPGEQFTELLRSLEEQTVKPGRIIVMNTDRALWETAPFDHSFFEKEAEDGSIHFEVYHITKEEFDHGGTRDRAAKMSQADVLLFMTQDALPGDSKLIENLLRALDSAGSSHVATHLVSEDRKNEETVSGETTVEKHDAGIKGIAAAYARQLPAKECNVLERYTRAFNYGPDSKVKSKEDLPRLGIKTYFCSNVCAAYDRKIYEDMGGFEKKAIFNEDMIFVARLIQAGYRVAYAADARVIHSHNYSGPEQFHRNFDLGVSQAQHPEIFQDVPSEGEGLRLVKSTIAYLCRGKKSYLIPKLIWQSGCKYLGYCLGKRYEKLPHSVVRWCSMNKTYWKENKEF